MPSQIKRIQETPMISSLSESELQKIKEIQGMIEQEIEELRGSKYEERNNLFLKKMNSVLSFCFTKSKYEVMVALIEMEVFQHTRANETLDHLNISQSISDIIKHNEDFTRDLDIVAYKMQTGVSSGVVGAGASTGEDVLASMVRDLPPGFLFANEDRGSNKSGVGAANRAATAATAKDSTAVSQVEARKAAEEKEKAAFNALIEAARKAPEDPGFKVVFSHWQVIRKKKPAEVRDLESITLRGQGLKDFQTKLDEVKNKGRLGPQLLKELYEQSEEYKQKNDEKADKENETARERLYSDFVMLRGTLAEEAKPIAETKVKVHKLFLKVHFLFELNESLLNNALLPEGQQSYKYADSRMTPRLKEKDKKDYNTLKASITDKKYNCAVDELFQKINEEMVKFEKEYKEKVEAMEIAFNGKNLAEMNKVWGELKPSVDLLRSYIARMKGMHEELTGHSNKLEAHRGLFVGVDCYPLEREVQNR